MDWVGPLLVTMNAYMQSFFVISTGYNAEGGSIILCVKEDNLCLCA